MQRPRIPETGNIDFGLQTVRQVDQSFVGKDTPDIEAVRWVDNQHSIDRLRMYGAPADYIDQTAEKMFTNERFQHASQTTLSTPRARYAFGELICRQAQISNALDGLVARLNPEPYLTPRQHLQKAIFGEFEPHPVNEIYDFAKVFKDKSVSSDAKRELVRLHTDALSDASKELEDQLPRLHEQFASALRIAVKAKVLPATAIPGDADPKRLKRLESLHIIVSDPLLNIAEERGGHFNPSENTIHIDANAVLKGDFTLRHVFNHEMLHAHSGFSVRLQDIEGMYDEVEDEPLDILDKFREHQELDYGSLFAEIGRLGLGRRSPIVNEAYTEWATMQISGDGYDNNELWAEFLGGAPKGILLQKYGAFSLYERIILAGLVARGIDIAAFGEAYFESYEPKLNNPKRDIGKTLPANRRLDALVDGTTPFKSLEQLTRYLEVEASKNNPESDKQRRLVQAHIVANDFCIPQEHVL